MSREKWIWPEGLGSDNAYALFRGTFVPLSDEGKICASVSTSGEYVLYINSLIAGFGQFPSWGNSFCEDIHDIADYCSSGVNSIELLVWNPGIDTQVSVALDGRARFAVRQSGTLLFSSGEDTLCAPDARYTSGPVPLITSQLGYSFAYDAGRENSCLGRARLLPDAPVHPRPVNPLVITALKHGRLCASGTYFETGGGTPAHRMQTAALSCGSDAAEQADGIYLVYDLGEETCGYFSFSGEFIESCDVLISFGEHLDDLRVRAEVGGRNFCAVYRAKPGYNNFCHMLRRWGCRYIQMHIPDKHARILHCGLKTVEYPLLTKPFFCENSRHTDILEMCVKTLRLCVHEHYEDCPWREQALYAMDSRIQMLCGYYAFGETRMPLASLKLLAEGRRADGLLPLCAPSNVPFTIPCFSLAYVVAVWEYLLFAYDAERNADEERFLEEILDSCRGILEAFDRNTDDRGHVLSFSGPRYWNFYEWNDGLSGTIPSPDAAESNEPDCAEGILTAWYALALDCYAKTCDRLGDSASAQRARRLYARTSAALEDFWDAELSLYAAKLENGKLSVFAEIMQSLVLLSVACPGERAEFLREKLTERNGMIEASLSNLLLRYQALMQEEEKYADFVFREIEEIWGGMLKRGATTCWETILGADDFDKAGSLCHGWSAVPIYFYYAYGLGVRPDDSCRMRRYPTYQTVLGNTDGSFLR